MHNLDWDDVRYFLETVNSGSITQAANHLGVNHTTVSRRIRSLEEKLGQSLFDRSVNGWAITQAGESIVGTAEEMAEKVYSIQRHALAESTNVSGLLRVTSVDVCITRMLMPGIKAFMQQYPAIELEVISSDDPLNLGTREADVAFRGTNNPPPNLVGKRIGYFAYAIYGTRELREVCINDPMSEEIPTVTWIGDSQSKPLWIQRSFSKSKYIYRVNSSTSMLEMTMQGLGIAQLPCAMCDPEPNLYRIPAKFVEPGWGLWVLSHVDVRTTARVRIFRDFMVEYLEKQVDLIEGRAPKKEDRNVLNS